MSKVESETNAKSEENSQTKKIESFDSFLEAYRNFKGRRIDANPLASPKEARILKVSKSMELEVNAKKPEVKKGEVISAPLNEKAKDKGNKKAKLSNLDNEKKKKVVKEKNNSNAATTNKKKGKKEQNPPPPSNSDLPQGDDDDSQFDSETGGGWVIPFWLQEDNIRDKEGRRPNEAGYDPSTLFIPPEEYQKMTPVFQQYWSFKRQHFDKLFALPNGIYYHFFYHDAFVLAKFTDMRLCNWAKCPLVAMHENSLYRYAALLIKSGYKFAIGAELTKLKGKDESVKKREICQIITRGTDIDGQSLDYSSRFFLAIYQDFHNFGLVLCDTTTHEFFMSEFKDTVGRSNLRTVLTRMKPVELVYMPSYIESDTLSIIKGLPYQPTLSVVSLNKPQHLVEILGKIKKLFSSSKDDEYPELFHQMEESVNQSMKEFPNLEENKLYMYERKVPNYFAMQALRICVEYLENVFLVDTVIPMGKFFTLDLNEQKKGSLYLDSQALENLQILDRPEKAIRSSAESLFEYMDKTVTDFGKRMFKKWLVSPLLDRELIQKRQEAVTDLLENLIIVNKFQEGLKKLPDIERMINKTYNLTNRKRMSGAFVNNFAKVRLKECLELLRHLRIIEALIEMFQEYIPNFSSQRLRELTLFKDSYGGIFPRINQIIDDLEKMVQISSDGEMIPSRGVNSRSDEIIDKMNEIKNSLQEYLDAQRKLFNNHSKVIYVHTKFDYEIEIPEELVEGEKKPSNYVVTSKRKGFLRFHTSEIENYVKQLKELQDEFKEIFVPFVCDYFKKFYERKHHWQQIVSCLGELDCLCGLAVLAASMTTKCLPRVVAMNDAPIFNLRDMVHPLVASRNPSFIPNDVIKENGVDVFLITGPNMGGKSTLLRQTCLAVVMAQVGSYIPAMSFEFTPVDRIFTRIGASDRILEGKSTFFIELEETYNIVSESTKSSLLIIDELGRGTSTYDGLAISFATLKYISSKIKCITLFATHYHQLLEEFESYANVENYVMECKTDEVADEIKFLYKFKKGEASSSHGIMIAKLAGLPRGVIKAASEKSKFLSNFEMFEKIIQELVGIDGGDSITKLANLETLLLSDERK